jgi:hypothetical protein
MKDYYQILGVHSHASHEEIRRAYRKLVVIYHPDRNPDPAADHKIKEINRAYDVLSDPVKRRHYDVAGTASLNPAMQEARPAHRDPAYRRRGTYPPPQPKKPGIHELMAKYRPYAVRASWVSLIFCSLLLLDYVLPARATEEKIISGRTDSGYEGEDGQVTYGTYIVTNYDSRYLFSTAHPERFEVNEIVRIGRSRLLAIPLYIASGGQSKEKLPASLFGNFMFLPIVLLITSVLGVLNKLGTQFQYSLGVVNLFILFLCLVFYFLFR